MEIIQYVYEEVRFMYKETFGTKLKKARQEAGYTQSQTEELTGIARAKISHYETGKREPDIETLGTLADFYCVSTDWLIGTKGYNLNITNSQNTRFTNS